MTDVYLSDDSAATSTELLTGILAKKTVSSTLFFCGFSLLREGVQNKLTKLGRCDRHTMEGLIIGLPGLLGLLGVQDC